MTEQYRATYLYANQETIPAPCLPPAARAPVYGNPSSMSLRSSFRRLANPYLILLTLK